VITDAFARLAMPARLGALIVGWATQGLPRWSVKDGDLD